MSNKHTNSNEKNKVPEFDEEEAYFELCQIFAEAIQTQNFNGLDIKIDIWKRKYPIDLFTMSFQIKIKRILSKDYLSYLIGDYLAAQVLRENEKQQKAYEELKSIIDTAKKSKNFEQAQKDVANWRKSNSIYDFNRVYKARVCRMLSKEYLSTITEKFKQKEALSELTHLIDSAKSSDDPNISKDVNEWMEKYPTSDFQNQYQKEIVELTTQALSLVAVKLNQTSAISEIKQLVEKSKVDSYLNSLSEIPHILSKYEYKDFGDMAKQEIIDLTLEATTLTTEISSIPTSSNISSEFSSVKQKNAALEFSKILAEDYHNLDGIFEWIYKYRNVTFNGYSKEYILTSFIKYYDVPKKVNYSIPSISMEDISVSTYRDFTNIKKQAILNYFGIMLYSDSKLSSANKDSLSSVQEALEVKETSVSEVPILVHQEEQQKGSNQTSSFETDTSFVSKEEVQTFSSEEDSSFVKRKEMQTISLEDNFKKEEDTQTIFPEDDIVIDLSDTEGIEISLNSKSQKEIESPKKAEIVQDSTTSTNIENLYYISKQFETISTIDEYVSNNINWEQEKEEEELEESPTYLLENLEDEITPIKTN